MKLLTISTLLLLFVTANAQHYEKYYDFHWQPCDAMQARYYSELTKKDSVWERKDYFIHERSLQMLGYYTDTSCKVAEGNFLYYYSNKNPESKGSYKNGKKEGLWLDYYSGGMMKDSVVYVQGNKTGTSFEWHPNG